MKTKKTLKLFLTILLFGSTISKSMAQVTAATSTISNSKSYWQLSTRIGYDFPLFKEDFTYIDYKGGLMGGLSLNKYWNHWGFQIDGDYIKNTPFTTIDSPANYFTTIGTIVPLDITTKKKDLTRIFVGIGPAYKWQSQSNKLTLELAALGGIGFINGGEILVEGTNTSLTPKTKPLTYHSGFDNAKAPTFKAQVRATYWFKGGNWGVNGGAYYMNHFGVKESQKNQLLIDNGYLANNSTNGIYYYEIGKFTAPLGSTLEGQTAYSDTEGQVKERVYGQGEDQQNKIKLASVGVFAGLSYRFITHKKPKICEAVFEKKKDEPCCGTCPIYGLAVTAKDKYTNEVLVDTDIAVKNSKGEIVRTGRTNSFGVVVIEKILKDNYTISGLLNNVALTDTKVKKEELICDKVLQKEIFYADRNFIVKGRAFVCNTTTPISGINVTLENKDLAVKKSTMTDAQGNFNLQLPETGTYDLYGRKENYFSQIEKVTATDYSRDKTLFVELEICAQEAECGKGLGLKDILFDLDKYVIKEIAKIELNRLVRFMQDNPTVKVEVGSHTDCRSSAVYNQKLSQNRANASVDYVVSQGISRNRITGKGYGESKLLNECADGVTCSEVKHSINRRTEMKVICPEKK